MVLQLELQSRISACVQALDVPFIVVSASEQNAEYRKFFLQNYPGKFQHVFCKLEDQLKEGACSLHNCEATCVSRSDRSNIDLMITGSPCDPFSLQRAKRFSHDGVKCHPDFLTTMKSVVSMYSLYEPRVAILEQVKGFTMPFEVGTTESPMDRLVGGRDWGGGMSKSLRNVQESKLTGCT